MDSRDALPEQLQNYEAKMSSRWTGRSNMEQKSVLFVEHTRISAVNATLEQGGRKKLREGETMGDPPSMWGKPHDRYRTGGGSTGQQLKGV